MILGGTPLDRWGLAPGLGYATAFAQRPGRADGCLIGWLRSRLRRRVERTECPGGLDTGKSSSFIVTSSKARSPSSFLLLLVRHLLLVAMHLLLEAMHLLLVALLLLVVRPGAPSGILAPSSDALCS